MPPGGALGRGCWCWRRCPEVRGGGIAVKRQRDRGPSSLGGWFCCFLMAQSCVGAPWHCLDSEGGEKAGGVGARGVRWWVRMGVIPEARAGGGRGWMLG